MPHGARFQGQGLPEKTILLVPIASDMPVPRAPWPMKGKRLLPPEPRDLVLVAELATWLKFRRRALSCIDFLLDGGRARRSEVAVAVVPRRGAHPRICMRLHVSVRRYHEVHEKGGQGQLPSGRDGDKPHIVVSASSRQLAQTCGCRSQRPGRCPHAANSHLVCRVGETTMLRR